MPASFIGLGGNTGDVFATMQRGLSALDLVAGIRVAEVSPAYETAPVGPARDTVFFNAAARLECDLSPRDLLAQLQVVEDRLGRTRSSRWGPRTLDLDLLLCGDPLCGDPLCGDPLCGDAVLASPTLTVPHPHLWYRRFVLDPLSDIAAEVTHPCFGETIGHLRKMLLLRPFPVVLVGASLQQRSALAAHLRSKFPEAAVTGDAPANLTRPPTSPLPGVPCPDAPLPSAITLDAANGQSASKQGAGEQGTGKQGAEGTEKNSSVANRSPVPACSRQVRLSDLPGTIFEAAESVLTAVLDEPRRHKRPLRRMP